VAAALFMFGGQFFGSSAGGTKKVDVNVKHQRSLEKSCLANRPDVSYFLILHAELRALLLSLTEIRRCSSVR
jgi:hypothetical protein